MLALVRDGTHWRIEVADDRHRPVVAEFGVQIATERHRRERVVEPVDRAGRSASCRSGSFDTRKYHCESGAGGVALVRGTHRPMSSMPSWSMSAATG